MTSYDYQVVNLPADWDILSNAEKCSFDVTILDRTGLQVGDQFRLTNVETGTEAVYTIARSHDDTELTSGTNKFIRMGKVARDRHYADTSTTPPNYAARFRGAKVPPRVNESAAEADVRETNEAREVIDVDTADRVLIAAPHDGEIEPVTLAMARECHETLATASTLWGFQGFGGLKGAFDRWHISPTDIDRSGRSFPGLGYCAVAGPYDLAVAFHGHTAPDTAVGGLCSHALRQDVAARAESIQPSPPDFPAVVCGYDSTGALLPNYQAVAGVEPENFVNDLTKDGTRGLQLVSPRGYRDGYGLDFARQVAQAIDAYLA